MTDYTEMHFRFLFGEPLRAFHRTEQTIWNDVEERWELSSLFSCVKESKTRGGRIAIFSGNVTLEKNTEQVTNRF